MEIRVSKIGCITPNGLATGIFAPRMNCVLMLFVLNKATVDVTLASKIDRKHFHWIKVRHYKQNPWSKENLGLFAVSNYTHSGASAARLSKHYAALLDSL